MGAESGVFLRKASGLRRSAGPWDVFIFDTGLISVGFALALNAYYIPGFYPHANLAISSLLATAVMVLAGVGFYLWAVLLPRSGGNYVFVSRALHPALGFVVSWVEAGVLLFYTGVSAAFVVRIGFATVLSGLGATTRFTRLAELGVKMGEAGPTFVLGSLVIALSTALLVVGMRRFFQVQRMMFAIAIVGTIALLGALLHLAGVPLSERFSRTFAGLTPDAVMAVARSKGWEIGDASMPGSMAAIGWPLLALAGGVLSVGIGAEVQRVRRSQLLGIAGSIVFSGVVFAVLGWLGERTLGRGLTGAIGFSASNAVDAGVPAGVPWMPFLVSALGGSWWLALLIGVGFVAWIYLLVPATLAYCNRIFLAWSLDRVAPAWLGAVSSTRQTPTTASVLGGGLAILFLAAYLWAPQLQTLVIFQALLFVWGISLLGGSLFPLLKRNLYRAAVAGGAVVSSRALFSGIMALGSAALFYSGYILWNDSISAGHSPLAVGVIAGLVVSGGLVYLVASMIRGHQGIELARSFREIPVE